MKRFVTFLLIAAAICCVIHIANNYEEIFANKPTVAVANNKSKSNVVPSTTTKSSATKATTSTTKQNVAQPKQTPQKPAVTSTVKNAPNLNSTTTKAKTNTPTASKTQTPQPKAQAQQPQAQSSQHLVFKGVAIDGTLTNYVKSMQSAGFTLLKSGNGIAQLRGDFAGHKGCIVKVSTLSNHDLVCTIDVKLTEREKWAELNGDYTNLKKMLTQKYGAPAKCVESFDLSFANDDSNKLFCVQYDKYKYYSIFKTAKGDITLRIDHESYDCFVSLTYSDKINSNLVNNTIMNDL